MSFDPRILDGILQCTRSRSKLVHDGEKLVCVDPECRLQFSIRDNIPVMLVDEAQQMVPPEWSRVMQTHGRDPQTGEVPGTRS
jgi:uncharacterized protein YbaR (Trm112 family)